MVVRNCCVAAHSSYALTILAALWAGEVSALLLHPRQTKGQDIRGTKATLSSVVSSDQPLCNELINEDTHSTVEILVGTPPQRFGLVADTGSNAVIVQSCLCRRFSPECKESEDCFLGKDRSSTFIPPKGNATMKVLSFGSGDIVAAVATDVVRMGQEQATMKDGLLLMVDRELNMRGHFEGIFGLGLPSWVEGAERPPKIDGAESSNPHVARIGGGSEKNETKQPKPDPWPRFLEEADVPRFSVCMNGYPQSGALRLHAPKAPKMLKQVGYRHWSLHFQGFSVGSPSNPPADFCQKKEHWQHIACAAVPDSGTTLMLGPRKQIDQLFAEVCHRWPRCRNNMLGADPRPETTFRNLIYRCSEWSSLETTSNTTSGNHSGATGGLKEVPSIFAHVGGADGESEVLEITSWAYIAESVDIHGGRVCEPMFGEFPYETALHGDVWIFGTPLFYEYQVVFDSHPPSLGFDKSDCRRCDEQASLVLDTGFARHRQPPRIMRGKPRMPSIDTREPL